MAVKKKVDFRHAVLPLSTLYYPSIADASQFKGEGKYKYRASFLVPKDFVKKGAPGHKRWVNMVEVILADAKHQYGKDVSDIFKAKGFEAFGLPIYDGDSLDSQNAKDAETLKGNFRINATANADEGRKPPRTLKYENGTFMVINDKEEIKELFYSGCKVWGKLHFYFHEFGKLKMSVGFDEVVFVADGERLAAFEESNPEDTYSDYAEDLKHCGIDATEDSDFFDGI